MPPIPERASGVKGLPANFFVYVFTPKPISVLLPVGLFGLLVEESVVECRLSRSCSARLLRRSFRVRRHPYPSLRESACLPAVVQARLGPDTEYSVATVSRTRAVSIRITLGNRGRVHWDTSDWPCVHEGLFFQGRRADATALLQLVSSSGFSEGLLASPCCPIMVLPGEAESGSAGKQPDKE